jgi:serine/threonine protein kinase
MSAITTSPEESSLQAPRDIGVVQGEVDDIQVRRRPRLRRFTSSPLDDSWLLNWHTSAGEACHTFFVTYITHPDSWHRLNIVVRRSLTTDKEYETAGSKIANATAASPDSGSRMIFRYVRALLQDGIGDNTITKLVISSSHHRQLHIQFEQDEKELAQLSKLSSLHDKWQVPIVKRISFLEHTGFYTYVVRCKDMHYIFQQSPDVEVLDDFLHQLHVLNSTISCPYMSNLAYVVYDEREEHIRGYLMEEHLERESLHAVLKREHENRFHIPWHVRRRWANQLLSAIETLHATGFVHGHLTLHNIFVVAGSQQPARQTSVTFLSYDVFVSCPKLTSKVSVPEVYLSPELLMRGFGTRRCPPPSMQSDVYALGVVLWALAMQNCEPALCKHQRGRLAMSYYHSFQPNAPTWGYRLRDAIQACLDARPQDRPTTNLMLRALKEDALDHIPCELETQVGGSRVSRSDAAEWQQAVVALGADLRILSEDDHFAGPGSDTFDQWEVEAEFEGLTAEERTLAYWECQARRGECMEHIRLMGQDAGVEAELEEGFQSELRKKKTRWW